MTARPSVSIVVPVHNNLQFLPAALESIRGQTYGHREVIVVDDGSRQPVDDLVRAILPDAIVLRQANAGPSAARNRGVQHATGDFVTFLDADDLWVENALALFGKGFVDVPSADVVQGYVRRFTGAGGESCDVQHRLGQPYLGFNVGALMARREFLLGLGPFDEALWQSEDVDLFMRMHEHRARRIVIPRLILEYRRHPDSLTEVTPPKPLEQGSVSNWIRLLHKNRSQRRTASEPASVDWTPNSSPTSPPISVVMAVRNGHKYLPAALDCLRRQTLAPAEIIAIVGPSTDGTLDYLQAQNDVRVLTQVGAGLAAARNQGVDHARGDLIAFLDHDDLWSLQKLALQSSVLALFAQPGACITNFRIVHDADVTDPAIVDTPRHQTPRLGWTPSALIAHREVFRTVGPFDPALGIGCDTDWFRRLALADVPCGVALPTLLSKRLHDSNLSHHAHLNRAAMFRIIEKHRAERRGE